MKPIQKQVIAITGATSGIGLATARLAASRGAKVFLIARNEDELRDICEDLQARGGEADSYAADVSDAEALIHAANRCVERFGRIDTWINNAGVSIYGKLLDTPSSDAHRVFETNFWGTFNGCKAAVPHLRREGGTLINIGSVVSEMAVPVQGIYSASKFALKGLTDSLRRELRMEKVPIHVTLVKPGAIDTPYTEHAQNRIGGQPIHTPPVYSADVVARTILRCSEEPIREIAVGASARIYPLLDRLFPRVQDYLLSRIMTEEKQRLNAPSTGQEALNSAPSREGRISGNYPGHVSKSSLYTEVASRPWLGRSLALAAGGVVSAYLMWRSRQESIENLKPSEEVARVA